MGNLGAPPGTAAAAVLVPVLVTTTGAGRALLALLAVGAAGVFSAAVQARHERRAAMLAGHRGGDVGLRRSYQRVRQKWGGLHQQIPFAAELLTAV